jgi:hypothetical protein
MKTILLAGVATAALASSAWALPDRYEGESGCVGASGSGCTQAADIIQTNQGNVPSEKSAEVASTGNSAAGDPVIDRAPLASRAVDEDDDEDVSDEIGDTAEEVGDDVGDEAEETGDDIADAASEIGDEAGDAADEAGDAIGDAFD